MKGGLASRRTLWRTGDTFEANAVIKAKAVWEEAGHCPGRRFGAWRWTPWAEAGRIFRQIYGRKRPPMRSRTGT